MPPWTPETVLGVLAVVVPTVAVIVVAVLQFRANRGAHENTTGAIQAVDRRAEERDKGLLDAIQAVDRRAEERDKGLLDAIQAVDRRAEERDRAVMETLVKVHDQTRLTAEEVAYLRGRTDASSGAQGGQTDDPMFRVPRGARPDR